MDYKEKRSFTKKNFRDLYYINMYHYIVANYTIYIYGYK